MCAGNGTFSLLRGDGYSKSVCDTGIIEPFCELEKDPAVVFMEYLQYLSNRKQLLSPENAPVIKVNTL